MRVDIVCRNHEADRVLPRFARYLAKGCGWRLTKRVEPGADAYYLTGYFESQMGEQWIRRLGPAKWGIGPGWPAKARVASLFTHREERDADKAALYDTIAKRVDLRVAMCRLYAEPLSRVGPTIQPPLPVERGHFTPGPARPRARRPVVGFSGFTYGTGRKGEGIARELVARVEREGRHSFTWVASGRGWPVPTRSYPWSQMPAFYRGLDAYVCVSTVEGGPMPVLEALSCGVPVVIPRGVGILDELPLGPGIFRYERGSAEGAYTALRQAAILSNPHDREALRAVTEPYTVEAWCRGHREGVE